ncbi:acyltransferase [Opitutaceae bacterium]|nr:acyltransferase [Opitutaceae bacterium]
MIGPHCFITDGNHGTDAISTVKSQPITSAPVEIGDGAWIGAHVTILPGVVIGPHAVIGAGSVVTKDIEANAIAFGSPASSKRVRQNSDSSN